MERNGSTPRKPVATKVIHSRARAVRDSGAGERTFTVVGYPIGKQVSVIASALSAGDVPLMQQLFLVFVTAASTGVFVPLPEEAVMIGLSVTAPEGGLLAVLVVAFLGLYIRDLALFLLGRVAGTAIFTWAPVRRVVGDAPLDSVRKRAEANAVKSVIAARMAFGVRAAAQVTLGAVGVPLRTHVVVNALVLAVWVPFLIGIGVLFHDPAVAAMAWCGENKALLLAFAAIIGLAWWTREATSDVSRAPEP